MTVYWKRIHQQNSYSSHHSCLLFLLLSVAEKGHETVCCFGTSGLEIINYCFHSTLSYTHRKITSRIRPCEGF